MKFWSNGKWSIWPYHIHHIYIYIYIFMYIYRERETERELTAVQYKNAPFAAINENEFATTCTNTLIPDEGPFLETYNLIVSFG